MNRTGQSTDKEKQGFHQCTGIRLPSLVRDMSEKLIWVGELAWIRMIFFVHGLNVVKPSARCRLLYPEITRELCVSPSRKPQDHSFCSKRTTWKNRHRQHHSPTTKATKTLASYKHENKMILLAHPCSQREIRDATHPCSQPFTLLAAIPYKFAPKRQ